MATAANTTNGQTPCLCSLDSLLDSYEVITASQVTLPPPTLSEDQQHTAHHGHFQQKLEHVFMRITNLILRKDKCCGDWRDYPSDDPLHDSIANTILIAISNDVQEKRQRLQPPVTELQLKGYKFAPMSPSDRHTVYYFLKILAGENFYLYVKAGLTNEDFAHIDLLRLTSRESVAVKD